MDWRQLFGFFKKCVFLKILHDTVGVLIHVFLINLSGNGIYFFFNHVKFQSTFACILKGEM